LDTQEDNLQITELDGLPYFLGKGKIHEVPNFLDKGKIHGLTNLMGRKTMNRLPNLLERKSIHGLRWLGLWYLMPLSTIF
jgi:hypothetical protein